MHQVKLSTCAILYSFTAAVQDHAKIL